MKEIDAMHILDKAAAAQAGWKMHAFDAIAKRLGVPPGTVYHWWSTRRIPPGRLSVFDLLKKRRVRA